MLIQWFCVSSSFCFLSEISGSCLKSSYKTKDYYFIEKYLVNQTVYSFKSDMDTAYAHKTVGEYQLYHAERHIYTDTFCCKNVACVFFCPNKSIRKFDKHISETDHLSC